MASTIDRDKIRDDEESEGGPTPRQIVRALIEAGAAVDAEDGCGCRPLWYALDIDQPDLANLLVRAGAGKDAISADYLKGRSFPRACRAPGFGAVVSALAERFGIPPRPWVDRPSRRDVVRSLRAGGDPPAGPTIGVKFSTSRVLAEALLAEQETWRRRGAFLVSVSCGDVGQTIGVLPTDDPYSVIAAVCAPGTDWGWVCPGFHIRDLTALERDYSFALMGCGARSLELEFDSPIADPAGLARRLGAIRVHPFGYGLSEHPDDEEVAECLAEHARIGFYWD